MKAKEYLLQVIKLDKMINNKLIELAQWKSIALGTSGQSEGERVQASGSQQKMADAIDKYIDIQRDIDAAIDRLIDTKRQIVWTIEQLPALEYDLLHMVYIQFKSLDDVADKYNKSYRWATTIHGRALANVQKLIDPQGN